MIDPMCISINHGKSSVLVSQGTIIAFPMEGIHYYEAIYPDARHFNTFGFVDIENEGSKLSDRSYITTKLTATPDDYFFGFGTSKNPCPGRFLAVHEIKLIVAYLLTNYGHRIHWRKT